MCDIINYALVTIQHKYYITSLKRNNLFVNQMLHWYFLYYIRETINCISLK